VRYDLYGNLYGNETLQKIVDLFKLSLLVHDKTNFGVKFETWGHCERIEIIIGKGKGQDFTEKIFKIDITMKKGVCELHNKENKAKVRLVFRALGWCLKEKKVTMKLKRAMSRLDKKLEVMK
jgi:hypothetical protein